MQQTLERICEACATKFSPSHHLQTGLHECVSHSLPTIPVSCTFYPFGSCLTPFFGLTKSRYRIMTSMHTLDLSHTDTKDEDLRNLVEFCPNLRVLKLVSCTNLSDEGVTYLAQRSQRLVVVDLSRDATLVSMRMSISLAAITELAKREHMYRVLLLSPYHFIISFYHFYYLFFNLLLSGVRVILRQKPTDDSDVELTQHHAHQQRHEAHGFPSQR